MADSCSLIQAWLLIPETKPILPHSHGSCLDSCLPGPGTNSDFPCFSALTDTVLCLGQMQASICEKPCSADGLFLDLIARLILRFLIYLLLASSRSFP